jgi:hypothetical protein
MAPVALYDSGPVEKSVFYPIAIVPQILYNVSIEYFVIRVCLLSRQADLLMCCAVIL